MGSDRVRWRQRWTPLVFLAAFRTTWASHTGMETGIEQELEDMQAARHEHELGKVSQAYWQKQRCVRCSSDVIPKLKHVSELHQADDCVILRHSYNSMCFERKANAGDWSYGFPRQWVAARLKTCACEGGFKVLSPCSGNAEAPTQTRHSSHKIT